MPCSIPATAVTPAASNAWVDAALHRLYLLASGAQAVTEPNHRSNAACSPSVGPSPTHATWPPRRTSTADGAGTVPTTGSAHVPA